MSKPDKNKENKKQNITIKKINIVVETNIEGEKPFSITYDKIYNPVKNRSVFSQKKLDYPYFTFDVKYDENVLHELNTTDYSELLRAFFDMTYFTSMVKQMREKNGDTIANNEKNKVINHNIFMMLYFLFPIKYPIPNNITSSFNSKICNSSKEFNVILNTPNIQTSLFSRFKSIEQEKIREYSYLNTSKGESTITQIIWLNDVLNEPRYRELIDILIQYQEWLSNRKITIKDDIQNAKKDLFKNNDDDGYFKKNELEIIQKEIKFEYSVDRFKQDVINEFDKIFEINDGFEVSNYFLELVQTKVIEKIEYLQNEYFKPNDKERKPLIRLGKFKKLLIDFGIIESSYYIQGEEELEYNFDNDNVEIRYDDVKNIKKEFVKTKISKENLKKNLINMVDENLIKLYDSINNTQIEKYSTNYQNVRVAATPTTIFSPTLKRIPSNGGADSTSVEISVSGFYKTFNGFFIPLLAASCGVNNSPKIINLEEKICPKNTGPVPLNIDDIKHKDFDLNDFFAPDSHPTDEFVKKIIERIKPFITKYNEYLKITLTKDTRYGALMRERETNINKILDEMNKINDNIMIKGKDGKENFKKVMNSIDSLKRFFSDDFITKNQLTGVSSIQIKVEKLLKMTNEINALQLTKTFFENSKGINLYYDKEQTKSNLELINELKKDKYLYFTNTVKFIKDKFINSNRESTNKELNNMMNTYFNNTSSDFIVKVIEPAKHAINDNERIDCKQSSYFNTLVTKTRPSNDQKDPEYEINLYMEVIVGKIDYQNQQNITCNYRDQNLIQMYNELTSSPNEFEVLKKNNTVFLSNIIDNVKKDVTNSASESQSISPNIQSKGGIRKRKTYRGRGKKIHKYTRKIR